MAKTLRADAQLGFSLNDDAVRSLNPAVPVSVFKPAALKKTALEFVRDFDGRVLYAVKCNPDPRFLRVLYENGVTGFDAASLGEVELIRGLFPNAAIYFMHPIKAPESIFRAYHDYGVRIFVLDYADELYKIIQTLPKADDLELFVRIAVPKATVATDFSTKFGAKAEDAPALLQKCRSHAKKLGMSFHVGTQCMEPQVYGRAVRHAAQMLKESGVAIEALDIGGGFPAALDPLRPIPPISAFNQAVRAAMKETGLEDVEIVCEAGRGLVADAGSLIVRIEGRKGNLLYINDGTYGGMFEAGGAIGLPYPAHLIRHDNRKVSGGTLPFRLAGPTCDSVDMMNGPFVLPEDAAIGDWILLDQFGAYGEVSRTGFNGFDKVERLVVE